MVTTQIKVIAALGVCLLVIGEVRTCRIGSEKLKSYAKRTVVDWLDSNSLQTIYWKREPLDARIISRATGLNISLAETRFLLDENGENQIAGESSRNGLIRDIFVTCTMDRDRSYSLSINLEFENPFNNIDLIWEMPDVSERGTLVNNVEPTGNQTNKWANHNNKGHFHIRLPQSTFLIQLIQRFRYDECLAVNYVQLAPNVSYELECASCSPGQQRYLNNVFNKRMNQIDSELDSILSEKLLLGIQLMLDQQRLDLELFME